MLVRVVFRRMGLDRIRPFSLPVPVVTYAILVADGVVHRIQMDFFSLNKSCPEILVP